MIRNGIFFIKWTFLSSIIGIFVGSASSFFLVSLDWVTAIRLKNEWLLFLLPVSGGLIGYVYYFLGKGVEKGNGLFYSSLENKGEPISFKLAPLILFTTLLTHLTGGSAGREGTAVQMGVAISSLLPKWLLFNRLDKKIILLAGISGGFSSVFGTPLAGSIFGLEVFVSRKRFIYLYPSVFAAFVAHFTTIYLWQVGHTQYTIGILPGINGTSLFFASLAGVFFGLTARLYIYLATHVHATWSSWIGYAPLRPFFGGVVLLLLFGIVYYLLDSTEYCGLGIPLIVSSFSTPSPYHAFLIKLVLTVITLAVGFKGGEVTPLFFIGAVLGSALSTFIPLPVGLLAGMGFIAVFSGSVNAPFSCMFLGMELFGYEGIVFFIIASLSSFFVSGKKSIYQ